MVKITDKINIDFQVLETHDVKTLVIMDSSSWGVIEPHVSVIEIAVPGASKKVSHYFLKGQLNAFQSNSLGLTCSAGCDDSLIDLPDGIYKITVKGSPDKYRYTRHYLRTYKFQLEVDKLYLKLLSSVDCGLIEGCNFKRLQDVQMLLDGASSAVRIGDIEKAGELFFRAKDVFKTLSCSKSCKR